MYQTVGLAGGTVKLYPDTAESASYDVRIMNKRLSFNRIAYDENLGLSDNFYFETEIEFEMTLTTP